MDPIEKEIEALNAKREDVKKQSVGPAEEIEALKAWIGSLEAEQEELEKQLVPNISEPYRDSIRQLITELYKSITAYNNSITAYTNRINELNNTITELYKLLPRPLVAEVGAQSKWQVEAQPDSAFLERPLTEIFANFLKESPSHPFSVLLLDERVRVSEDKKRAAALGALHSAPEDWTPIQDVKDDDVQETVGRFRELMTCTFVLQKLETFMSAVSVPFSLEQVPHGVDAFLRATYRGFFKECWASEYFFGVTLDLEHVLVCDDVVKLPLRVHREDVHPATGQRLLTLLHEFAHFFPRFVTAQSSGKPKPYETPPDKKPNVSIVDFPDVQCMKEAGDMFERLLFGRAFKSHLSVSGASRLMKWAASVKNKR